MVVGNHIHLVAFGVGVPADPYTFPITAWRPVYIRMIQVDRSVNGTVVIHEIDVSGNRRVVNGWEIEMQLGQADMVYLRIALSQSYKFYFWDIYHTGHLADDAHKVYLKSVAEEPLDTMLYKVKVALSFVEIADD